MVYILKCNTNIEATEFYLNIIKDMFLKSGYDVNICDYNNEIPNHSIIIVSTVLEFWKYYIKGYHKIFYWMQGIEPEESFLKHKNYIKKWILDFCTCIAIRLAKGIFFVSDEMKKYIEKKYHMKIKDKYFIMPCFNTYINKKSFQCLNKYKNNIFTYVGSLSEWQCFEETVDLYKKIESMIPNTELRIYTFSVEKAKIVLEQKKVKRYLVDRVKPEKIPQVLEEVKFGFNLRQDISVNNVSTPTKLSSYLSAGVIPIFSSCIKDFYNVISNYNMKYIIAVDDYTCFPEKILELCNIINESEIYSEYMKLFSTYYNRERYVIDGEKWLKKLFS